MLQTLKGCALLQYVLGKGGVALMLIIIFMAVTSAGSSEFMAVGSLFTFDIYKVGWRPCTEGSFRCHYRPASAMIPCSQQCALSAPGGACRGRCMRPRWHALVAQHGLA